MGNAEILQKLEAIFRDVLDNEESKRGSASSFPHGKSGNLQTWEKWFSV